MKLTIAWNVWNNYRDTLLGSEIVRLCNRERARFDDIALISQGGYPTPPTADEARYLDDHLDVNINEDNDLIRYHPKFRGVFRVLSGIRQAYEYALARGSDFVVVTNADAWCLDLDKLATLLRRQDVQASAVSARIGLVTGLDINFGAYVPFFDDHFMILNIALCKQYGVFEYIEPKAFKAHFSGYGGIHYMLGAMMDERVPLGAFNAYTHLADCVNHFGEKSGYSLLPWQYQPMHGFLHANCEQEPDLHPLRAAMLRLHQLDRFPANAAYCSEYDVKDAAIGIEEGYVYYRKSLGERLTLLQTLLPYRIYLSLLRRIKYEKHAAVKSALCKGLVNALTYLDRYRGILPLALASRRRRV